MNPLRFVPACLLAIALSLALCLPLSGCQHTPASDSPLSDPTQSSLSLLIDQLGLSESSAIDVLGQLHRAGYTEAIRMAFATEQPGVYRLWLESSALDITLDEDGFLTTICDGDTVLTVSLGENKTEIVEKPVEIVDNPESNFTQTVENTPATLQLVSLTTPLAAGSKATLIAHGQAGTEYTISVRYASGESTAKGLEPQVADENGTLTWTFLVSSRVAAGEYPVTVRGGGETLTLTLTVVAP